MSVPQSEVIRGDANGRASTSSRTATVSTRPAARCVCRTLNARPRQTTASTTSAPIPTQPRKAMACCQPPRYACTGWRRHRRIGHADEVEDGDEAADEGHHAENRGGEWV